MPRTDYYDTDGKFLTSRGADPPVKRRILSRTDYETITRAQAFRERVTNGSASASSTIPHSSATSSMPHSPPEARN